MSTLVFPKYLPWLLGVHVIEGDVPLPVEKRKLEIKTAWWCIKGHRHETRDEAAECTADITAKYGN